MSTGTVKDKVGLRDTDGTDIDPATEDKQDDAIVLLTTIDADTGRIPTNPSTEEKQDDAIENQTDGTQKTQIVDGVGDIAGVVSNLDKTINIDGLNGLVTATAVFGRVDDATIKNQRLDASTEANITISNEHHEVHGGTHYIYTDGLTLANTATQQWMITVPAGPKECHMVFTFISGLGTIWTLYEAGDRVGTDLQVAGNSNRNSDNEAGCIVHKNTSGGTTDGNLLATLALGSASAAGKAGGTARSAEELILKFSTKYLLTATSQANANNVTVFMTFYEHTPRN